MERRQPFALSLVDAHAELPHSNFALESLYFCIKVSYSLNLMDSLSSLRDQEHINNSNSEITLWPLKVVTTKIYRYRLTLRISVLRAANLVRRPPRLAYPQKYSYTKPKYGSSEKCAPYTLLFELFQVVIQLRRELSRNQLAKLLLVKQTGYHISCFDGAKPAFGQSLSRAGQCTSPSKHLCVQFGRCWFSSR